MPKQTKSKIGCLKLPKGEARGRIVPVRFSADELKRIMAAAGASARNFGVDKAQFMPHSRVNRPEYRRENTMAVI